MDKFETQFADLDVQTSYMEDTISNTTAVTMPQDQVDLLMQQMADEAKVELQQNLGEAELPDQELNTKEKVTQEDDKLAERLRALRPAT
jgi:charged multivesicular body protein 1